MLKKNKGVDRSGDERERFIGICPDNEDYQYIFDG